MGVLAALLLDLLAEGPVTLTLNKDKTVTGRCAPPGEKPFSVRKADIIETIGELHTEGGLKDDERDDDADEAPAAEGS